MAKRSNEPVFWSMFGAGGMLTAFITPVMILITGILVPLGIPMSGLSYETMHGFAGSWLGKLILLAVLALPLWHAAHRIFHGMHDLGIHGNRTAFMAATYGLAALLSAVVIVLLLTI